MFTTRNSLLGVGADPKTIKGLKKGVLTGVLYLAPYDVSGYQVCPNSTKGCQGACLYTSGHGRFTKTQESRINKTKWFFEDRESFMQVLIKDIEKLIRKADRENLIPAIRLNGTSDIAWEKIRVVHEGVTYRSIIDLFSDTQFYDYTKVLGRSRAISLDNYQLTFSLAEDNDAEALKALDQGYNVAVVMDLKKNDPKPAHWGGFPVIDGDETDVRFMDEQGNHIVALFAKGDAKKDTSGFVRSSVSGFNNKLKVRLVA
jgi:hypothetical protein